MARGALPFIAAILNSDGGSRKHQCVLLLLECVDSLASWGHSASASSYFASLLSSFFFFFFLFWGGLFCWSFCCCFVFSPYPLPPSVPTLRRHEIFIERSQDRGLCWKIKQKDRVSNALLPASQPANRRSFFLLTTWRTSLTGCLLNCDVHICVCG